MTIKKGKKKNILKKKCRADDVSIEHIISGRIPTWYYYYYYTRIILFHRCDKVTECVGVRGYWKLRRRRHGRGGVRNARINCIRTASSCGRDRANSDLLFGFGGGGRARCIISNKTRGDATFPTHSSEGSAEEVPPLLFMRFNGRASRDTHTTHTYPHTRPRTHYAFISRKPSPISPLRQPPTTYIPAF